MHYNIRKTTIKSEYAAKSIYQQNREVISWIESLKKNQTVLDYGCGKLRYTIPLDSQVDRVIAVDSELQINRIQKIAEEMCTPIEFASSNLDNTTILSTKDAAFENSIADKALCSNVLSAIPIIRERVRVLKRIWRLLTANGQLFLCTQYRNSYFKSFASNPKAVKHNDGWIVQSKSFASFYGILTKKDLIALCHKSGFKTLKSYVVGESAYVLAERAASK